MMMMSGVQQRPPRPCISGHHALNLAPPPPHSPRLKDRSFRTRTSASREGFHSALTHTSPSTCAWRWRPSRSRTRCPRAKGCLASLARALLSTMYPAVATAVTRLAKIPPSTKTSFTKKLAVDPRGAPCPEDDVDEEAPEVSAPAEGADDGGGVVFAVFAVFVAFVVVDGDEKGSGGDTSLLSFGGPWERRRMEELIGRRDTPRGRSSRRGSSANGRPRRMAHMALMGRVV